MSNLPNNFDLIWFDLIWFDLIGDDTIRYDKMLRERLKYDGYSQLNLLDNNITEKDAVGDRRLLSGSGTWRTGRNMRVVFHSDPFTPLCENMTSCTKQEVHNVKSSQKDRATATDNTYRNLVKFGMRILRYANRQTDKHTDTRIAILRTRTGTK